MEKQVWLDTFEYEEDFDSEYIYEYCKDELENFINRYEKRYHTTVNGILLIGERESHYGWIGGNGAKGYRLIENVEQLFNTYSDDMKIYVENGLINVDYFDHDGATHSTIKLISESAYNAVYGDLGCYACELDYTEYFEKKGQLKPTKFWNAK